MRISIAVAWLAMSVGLLYGAEIPPDLVGRWEHQRGFCFIPDSRRDFEGTLLISTSSSTVGEMTFRNGGEGDVRCEITRIESASDKHVLSSTCGIEDSVENVIHNVEINRKEDGLDIVIVDETHSEIMYYKKCPNESEKLDKNYISDIIGLISKTIKTDIELVNACSNTYQTENDLSVEERLFNIVSCENALDQSFEYARFITGITGGNSQPVCWREPSSRRERVESFLAFAGNKDALPGSGVAPLLYFFALNFYKCK